jgi:hypothetical protein
VTYGLGIFLLNLLIGFLTPLADPDGGDGEDSGGPILPTNDGDEFKPFIPRLSEFKFWCALLSWNHITGSRSMLTCVAWGLGIVMNRYSCARALVIGLAMTFFSIFDIPVSLIHHSSSSIHDPSL